VTTKHIDLDASWQQVTDGTTYAFIQIASGVIYMADSAEAPGPGAAAHTLTSADRGLNIAPPVTAWIRTGPDSPARAVVTQWK